MKKETRINGPQLSWRKRFLFWTMLFVLVITSSLIISEIILRILYREEEIDGSYWGIGAFEYADNLGYRHTPGFSGYVVRPDVFISHVEINQFGLRQANFEEQMQYPTRLLILGDSFAFGLGVNEESTFASLIQTELNLEGVGIINGAQSGYSVEQEMRFGISLAREVRPDIIILSLYPVNDIPADYIKGYRNEDVVYGYRLENNRLLPIPVIDFIRTHSYLWMFLNRTRTDSDLWMYLDRKIDSLKKPNPGIQDWQEFKRHAKNRPNQVIQPSLNALIELRDFCENNNIWFGIMIIPDSTVIDEELRMALDHNLMKALNEYGFDILDLGKNDFNEQDYFLGDGHWDEDGHQKAAQYLVPFVRHLLNK